MSKDLIPTRDEMNVLAEMAKYANDSKFFNQLGGLPGIMSIALYSRELGLPPMQCLMGGMHCIQGKIELSARMMNAMVRKAGHKIEILESNPNKCVLKGTRKDDGTSYTASFSMEDAKRAGLVRDKTPWATYPEQMLFTKAIKKLCTFHFPDVIGSAEEEGLADELDHFKKSKGTIDIEPATSVAESSSKVVEETITSEQAKILESMIAPGDEEYGKRILASYKVDLFDELPALTPKGNQTFETLLKAIRERNESLVSKEMETANA